MRGYLVTDMKCIYKGFEPLGYSDWKKRYDALKNSKFPRDAHTIALSSLLELAKEYRRTHGRENLDTGMSRDLIDNPLLNP